MGALWWVIPRQGVEAQGRVRRHFLRHSGQPAQLPREQGLQLERHGQDRPYVVLVLMLVLMLMLAQLMLLLWTSIVFAMLVFWMD